MRKLCTEFLRKSRSRKESFFGFQPHNPAPLHSMCHFRVGEVPSDAATLPPGREVIPIQRLHSKLLVSDVLHSSLTTWPVLLCSSWTTRWKIDVGRQKEIFLFPLVCVLSCVKAMSRNSLLYSPRPSHSARPRFDKYTVRTALACISSPIILLQQRTHATNIFCLKHGLFLFERFLREPRDTLWPWIWITNRAWNAHCVSRQPQPECSLNFTVRCCCFETTCWPSLI